MRFIYDSDQIKLWDNFTITNEPVSSTDLMERAGQNAAKRILSRYYFNSVSIFCGMGNNGGDGLVIARILALRGIETHVFCCNYTAKKSADFSINYKRLPKEVRITQVNEQTTFNLNSDLIIDCIFGIGLNKPVTGWLENVISIINSYKKPVVSIDLPSGLYATNNTKNSLHNVIKADLTVSFQAPKMCFFHAEYAQFVGKFELIDIGLHSAFKAHKIAHYIERHSIQLNKRAIFSHKGTYGYLTAVGGYDNMIGAAILVAKAAFRAGCGYVGVNCNSKGLSPLISHVPEVIFIGENLEIPQKTTAIAIGPGLGTTPSNKEALKKVLLSKLPLVIDADAIQLLSSDNSLLSILPKNSILTPHIGELDRLIGESKNSEERLKKQLEFSAKHNVYIIQKGAFSKLSCPNGDLFINSSGNAGMASAGMGDVLTGIIGSFLAQGYSPLEAAKNGVFIHGFAGDLACNKNGETALLASDLIESIQAAITNL